MRTKFIKVAVSDELPELCGGYYVISSGGEVDYLDFNSISETFFHNTYLDDIEYWLKEAPNHEAELVEMLEYLVKALKTISSFGATTPIIERAESLIQKVKP